MRAARTIGLWLNLLLGAGSLVAQPQSLDEIDRRSFKAGPSPLERPAAEITLVPGAAAPVAVVSRENLDGVWQMAADGEEAARLGGVWRDAIPATVPGSVHTALVAAGRIPDPKYALNDAIAREQSLRTWWFRRTFRRPAAFAASRLVFDGVAIHGTVWLNGARLGEHEGMFGGPSFDVAGRLRDENTLVVKLDPAPQGPPRRKGGTENSGWMQTVVFNNTWGWHYSNIPPLGIWRSVRLESTPAVCVAHPFVITHDAAAGDLSLIADLEGAAENWSGTLTGAIEPDNFDGPSWHFTRKIRASAATEKLHLRFKLPEPRLWWPNDLGPQNLYRLRLSFTPEENGRTHAATFTFGVRTVAMAPLPGGPHADKYNWTFIVNGRPVFIKGTGWCTLDSSMDFSRARYERFVSLAKLQHVQMLRGWGSGMPETDDFYDLCDRAGILVMQEWPTAWDSDRVQPFDALEETVRLNTLRLRSHPSLALYGGGNESKEASSPAIDMMGRLAIELDGTRAFHRSEPWGGSVHDYRCWWSNAPLDHNLTLAAPFLGEFGIASMPVLESVRRYVPPDELGIWPPPAGGALRHHTPIFDTRNDWTWLSHYAGYFTVGATLEDFIRGSQIAQVVALRHTLERARTRWPESTGALYYKLNDNYPAASWAVVDWYGAIKPAHWFCQQAFAPLHAVVLFERTDSRGRAISLPVFLLDDADALKGAAWEVSVRAYDGTLRLLKEERFTGTGSIRAPHRLGDFALTAEQNGATPLFVVSEVKTNGELADRTFYFVNYEAEQDSLFRLPRTMLTLQIEPGVAIVTNTGSLPAVAVAVHRPGHAETFTAAENYLWLEPGESRRIKVSDSVGLTVTAWNQF